MERDQRDLPNNKLDTELQIRMLQLEIRLLKTLLLKNDVCTYDVLQRQSDKIMQQTLKATHEDVDADPLTKRAISELIIRDGTFY